MDKLTIRDIDVSGRRVLVRVDFNVPLDEKTGKITDDSRIRATLPTIEYLIARQVKVILCSHLGRPGGKVVDKLRLTVVAQRLSQILGKQVGVTKNCIGSETKKSVANLRSGDVIFLENLRFHSAEERDNPVFAQALAKLADIYVNDAFGTSHRSHASIVRVADYLPSVAGLLLERELETLGSILENPARPFCGLLGGAKVSDKVEMLENILNRVDSLLIGGGMAATFLKAKSYEVGLSLIEADSLDTVVGLIDKASKNGVRILLPVDVIVADGLDAEAKVKVVSVENVSPRSKIVDIGPQTIKNFSEELQKCKTIFWNGPMGIYEIPQFAEGTKAIARLLAGLDAATIIGGGSTAEIVIEMKLASKITFVSTGGGATLRYLSDKKLPGVEVLLDKKLDKDWKEKRLTSDIIELIKPISRSSLTRIVLLVIDGLGGLPNPQTGKTELETANTPNLDKLATRGICGLIDPVSPGITPGSAPGHLALFGYDPVTFNIGRGVLEAIGVDFDLQQGDIAARGNFCTVDETSLITDRRAGRISTEKCAELCQLLNGVLIEGVKLFVYPVKEHRFIAVFRGEGLVSDISDSDPQQIGLAPKIVTALRPEAAKMAGIINQFIAQAKETLAEHYPVNMLLLRGFSQRPQFPTMGEIYKLKPAAIASYPMYRGLAKLVGMEVLKTGSTIEDEFITLKQNYANYDFFFLHIKGTDSAGEDGDFEGKVRVIEEVDSALPSLTSLESDVIVVTGDHSTPALLKGHSWHPVPILLYSKWCRPDRETEFSESACVYGGLGRFPGQQIMTLAMANALKLDKFGA
jgi:2,3-bisphosphoglycerate-independent phosphoglycerate mutase